jgi:hypothetical protein
MTKTSTEKENKQISVSTYIPAFIFLCMIIFSASTYGAMMKQGTISYFGFNFAGAVCLYVMYVLIIASDVLENTCMEGKQNNISAYIGSIPMLFFPMIAVACVFFLPSFFKLPFTELMGENLGTTLAVAINVTGLSLSAHVISYYSILKNGCSV